jgi:hypothetical protein
VGAARIVLTDVPWRDKGGDDGFHPCRTGKRRVNFLAMERLIPAHEDVRLFLLTFAAGLVFFSTFIA